MSWSVYKTEKHESHTIVLLRNNRTGNTNTTDYQKADSLVRKLAHNIQLIGKGYSIDGYPQRRYYFENSNLK